MSDGEGFVGGEPQVYVGAPPGEAGAIEVAERQEIARISQDAQAMEAARQALRSAGANPEYAAEYEYRRRTSIAGGIDPYDAANRALYADPDYHRGIRNAPTESKRTEEPEEKKAEYEGEPQDVYGVADQKRAFNEMVKSGDIPEGSVFVASKNPTQISYYTKEQWAEVQKQEEGSRTQLVAQSKISKYYLAGGYNIAQALADGVPERDIIAAGFTKKQIDDQAEHVRYLRASPQEKFEILKAQKGSGIPTNAHFAGVDEQGNIKYKIDINEAFPELTEQTKATAEQKAKLYNAAVESFKKENTDVQLTMAVDATGRKVAFDKLTQAEQQRVINRYTKAQAAGDIIIQFTPVLGTIKYWNQMSTAWKVVSIATDVLFIASPVVSKAVSGMAKEIQGIGRIEGSLHITDAINSGKSAMANELFRQDSKLASAFEQLNKAQLNYADDYMRVREIERLLKLPASQLSDEARKALMFVKGAKAEETVSQAAERSLKLANQQLADSQRVFEQAARNYSNEASRFVHGEAGPSSPGKGPTIGTGIDIQAKEALNDLSKDLPRATRELIDKTMNPRTIEAIRADLQQAQGTLRKAMERWPTEPAKWSDLRANVSALESELMVTEIGDTEKMAIQLSDLRSTAKALEKAEREARLSKSPYLNDIIQARKQARLQSLILEQQIDRIVHTMDVEWPESGFLGRGRIPTTSPRVKPGKYMGGGGKLAERGYQELAPAVAGTGAKAIVAGQEEPLVGVPLEPQGPETIRVWPHPSPTVMPWEPGSKPFIIPKMIVEAPTKPETQPQTRPEVHPGIRRIYGPGIEPMPQPKPAEVPAQYPEAEPIRKTDTQTERRAKVIFQALVKQGVSTHQAIRTLTSLGLRTQPAVRELTLTRTQEAAQAKEEAALKAEEKVIGKTSISIKTKTPPPEKPPVKKGTKPPIKVESVKGTPSSNAGPVIWRQGEYWISIEPPYRPGTQDVRYSTKPPSDAKQLLRTPQQTLFHRGRPPKEINLGMGIVKSQISHGKHIKFYRQHIKLT